MKKIELLAPAGSLDKLKIAFMYGADACYIGGIDYSLRANAKNFTVEEIKEACDYAHKINKKVYVTVNIVFHNDNYSNLVTYLQALEKCSVDAIIVSDPFIIDVIKENNINIDIHISTQFSLLNYQAVNFFKDEKVTRVVLGRESSKENIKEIIDKTGMEVEVFTHGAMCSSYSGRCVLSNYFTNRDANRGGCAQVCRWEFDLYNNKLQKISGETKFTMSTKDLSMINYLEEMIEIGISSLKIEGRMRSNYYIATVINTYRSAIDDYYNNNLSKENKKYYNKILRRVANRDNTDQFFNRLPGLNEQYFLGRVEESNQDFLGIVLDYDEANRIVTIEQRNYFKPGDIVEMFGPNIETFSFTVPEIYNEEHEKLEVARHPKEIIKFKLEKKVYQFDIMRIKI